MRSSLLLRYFQQAIAAFALLAAIPQAAKAQPSANGQLDAKGKAPALVPMDCAQVNSIVSGNTVYLLYKKARSLKQDQTIRDWQWYKSPPPNYDDQTLDPLAEQPVGVHPAAFQRKLIQCAFPLNAQLEGADFHGSDLTNSTFTDGSLREASFDRWNGNGPATILHNVTFSGVDLTNATFDHADMTGVHFEPGKLPDARDMAKASHLEQMTYDEDPSALAALRQRFRDGGFSLQANQINYAIHITELHRSAQHCALLSQEAGSDYRTCIDFFGSEIINLTCQYGMNLWRPVTIGLCASVLFALLFFAFMHHSGPSGLYLAVADGLTLEPESIRHAPQVLSTVAVSQIKQGNLSGWLRAELGLLRTAFFFSLVNGFNIGFKDADVGRWIRLLPPREFEFRAVGWSRTFAGVQALLTLYLLAIWVLCLFGHPFD